LADRAFQSAQFFAVIQYLGCIERDNAFFFLQFVKKTDRFIDRRGYRFAFYQYNISLNH